VGHVAVQCSAGDRDPGDSSSYSGEPEWARAEWDFDPGAPPDAPKPMNARAETVAISKYFREAFAHRRCLVPPNGQFEWQVSDGRKQPWLIAQEPREALAPSG